MPIGVASSGLKTSGEMRRFVWRLLLVFYLCFLYGASAEMNVTNLHVASFSMSGASGQAQFFQESPDADVTVDVALVGVESGNYLWTIHEKPMIYGQQPVCDDALIGRVIAGDDLSVAIVSNTGILDWDFQNAEISLKGPQSITGRTLVLTQVASQKKYCAAIANSREMTTAVARFDAPFASTVTFRQEKDNPEADTSIFVDLYDVTDPLTLMTYAWRISSNNGYNYDMDLATWCAETSPDVYNPTGVDAMACGMEDPSLCPIGHLTGKFDDINVKPIPSAKTRYFIDTNLALSGENSVLGKSLVFSDMSSGNYVACSPILELKPKSVEALFSVKNVSGTVRFSQRSPYDATEMQVQLENLGGVAKGIHLQELPLPPRTYASDNQASPDNVAGHHNPYGVDISTSPAPGIGTHDQYEVGDLTGKFGLLTGNNNFSATYSDWNLPLFGRHSIIGRSLVIHNTEGERWLYAAIGYPAKKKTVRAVFKAPSVGKIVMSQDIDDPYADTSIFIEMAYADGSPTTAGHNWHIHTRHVADDYISTDGRCSSCEGHYNPFNVDLGSQYSECSTGFPQRCELGDLSAKYSQLTITDKMNLGAGKFFFVETGLPLSGAYSIAGRSIVIHAAEAGSSRMACANLLEVPPTETTAELWSDGPVSGDISFQQESVFDPVQVHVNVEGLSSLAGGWHVHLLPIDENMDSAPCSPASVQGHYNPFGVVGSPAYGTQDMYEMGDLSGKFGAFSGSSERNHVYYDTNLALEGPRSIIGRSLVVHKSDGSRWVCATLHRKTRQDDFIMKARAVITTPDYTGNVILTQTRYHTGALGDTTVDFVLQSNVAEADTFFWNLKTVEGEGTCSESSSIYNPHEVSMDADYGAGGQCDTKSQLRCAVGDLLGKHGNLSSTVKRAVYTDINLPLAGRDSVLGLSLHFISTNTGQFSCGMLEPDPSLGRVEYLSYPSSTKFDPYKFRQAMHGHMSSAEMWQIVATQAPQNNPVNGCEVLKFYFVGTGLDDMDQEFKQKANADELGEYSPTSQCRDASGGSSRTTSVGLLVFAVLLAHCLVLRLSFKISPRIMMPFLLQWAA